MPTTNDAHDGESPPSGSGAHRRDVGEIQAEVEQNREELGRTVEALSQKLDVKTRAAQWFRARRAQTEGLLLALRVRAARLGSTAQESVVDEQGRPKPIVPAACAALVTVVIAGLLIWRRRRR